MSEMLNISYFYACADFFESIQINFDVGACQI